MEAWILIIWFSSSSSSNYSRVPVVIEGFKSVYTCQLAAKDFKKKAQYHDPAAVCIKKDTR